MTSINCPSCGGHITSLSPLIRSIDCEYCGAWLRFDNHLWEIADNAPSAMNVPAFLSCGMQGTYQAQTYHVKGRIRLGYDDGAWDEWWVEDQHQQGFWLEEDDGMYLRHEPQMRVKFNQAAAAIEVGSVITLQQQEQQALELYVTECIEARVVGREGSLPIAMAINSPFICVDGLANDIDYAVEIANQMAQVSITTEFPIAHFAWQR